MSAATPPKGASPPTGATPETPATPTKAALAILDRLVRPSPWLALFLVVAAALSWSRGALTPGAALEALETDASFALALGDGDWAAAAEAGRRRRALPVVAPDVDHLSIIGEALYRSGAVGEGILAAEAALEGARGRYGEASVSVAMAANNLAWFLVSLEQPTAGDLAEARALTREALAVLPDNPFFLGTAGTVALARGDLDAAREHLVRAIEHHDPPALAATDRAILAIAFARQGDERAARRALEEARADGIPDPRWLARAEALVKAAPPADDSLR